MGKKINLCKTDKDKVRRHKSAISVTKWRITTEDPTTIKKRKRNTMKNFIILFIMLMNPTT